MSEQPQKKMNYVQYATQVMGVDAVYAEANQYQEALDATNQELADVRDKLRKARSALLGFEFDMTQSFIPEDGMSKTAVKEAIKAAIDGDEQVRAQRDLIASLEVEKAGLEDVAKQNRLGIQVAASRMVQQGGLLQFYAVNKLTDLHNMQQAQLQQAQPHTERQVQQ